MKHGMNIMPLEASPPF